MTKVNMRVHVHVYACPPTCVPAFVHPLLHPAPSRCVRLNGVLPSLVSPQRASPYRMPSLFSCQLYGFGWVWRKQVPVCVCVCVCGCVHESAWGMVGYMPALVECRPL